MTANNFNILITSISKKVPLLKMVRQSVDNLGLISEIHGADTNNLCVGRYFVDDFWQMPLLEKLDYTILKDFCKKHEIKAIIPTRDGELSYFAKHQENLLENGVACMISKPEVIEKCDNKQLFYEFLSSSNIPAIPTTSDIKLISSDLYVVKECFGVASKSMGLKLNALQAKSWAQKLKNPVFQPFIEGKEYSVDLYVDRKNTSHGTISRTRDLIVDGESQITSSLKHKKIESICTDAALLLGIYGHAVFQVLEDIKGNIHIIECNARFGGASTLSFAMGLNSAQWFIQESLGQTLPPFVRSAREMRQVRYPEDKVFLL